jgi:putative DNA methylase
MTSPRRLIEVDLPIRRISVHARREKSIRHGHISTLHIWWARRPLAACRAVSCAALWLDPVDSTAVGVAAAGGSGQELQPNACPPSFRAKARDEMLAWTSYERQVLLSVESRPRFEAARKDPTRFDNALELRAALLDFIADFANWDNTVADEFLNTSRALTEAAHIALGGTRHTRPLVVDPFAGGGSIPLECLRIGADTFASDVNPIPVLLNKVVLEYIPKYRQGLADSVRKWGAWIKRQAENELGKFYPKDANGAIPIAYLWARTIRCEGPGCGWEVPLMRSFWLAKRPKKSVALQLHPNRKASCLELEIIVNERDGWVSQSKPERKIVNPDLDGTIKRGSVTCPNCGYTTPVTRVREQLKKRGGGTNDARLVAVVTARSGEQGRSYRLPTELDVTAVGAAKAELQRRKNAHATEPSLVPEELISLNEIRRISLPLYGMTRWGDVFSDRQNLVLTTLSRYVRELNLELAPKHESIPPVVVQTVLALAVDRLADSLSSSVTWTPGGEFQGHTFTRQALAFVSDYAEVNPWCDSSGNWMGAVEWVSKVCESWRDGFPATAQVECASATAHPLPDDSVDAVITDPPYYDAVPYAHLSDFFYVWLRRSIGIYYPNLFKSAQVEKDREIVVDRPHELSNSTHDIAFYERELNRAFAESRRIVRPGGIAVIVFASKTTASWEAILKAVVDAGWVITGSWPIDTEREARMAAQGQARLASSVHLVCRPRINAGDGLKDVGDWRDVLHELPRRIHEWMPRLAEEAVVGADAIFACLGPALEVFSRYARVEKASGETVTLKEYLEHVWAAVAKEALAQVFRDADTASFEPDARLTAMWLWTLKTGANGALGEGDEAQIDVDDSGINETQVGGAFVLEYDAARKIAQGLGANLDNLDAVVQVSGDTARLIPVSERTGYLFGKPQAEAPAVGRKKAKAGQMDFFAELIDESRKDATIHDTVEHQIGATALDRVHQAMILFAIGRDERLKRFLIGDSVGQDSRFWGLAQALSALYPQTSSEKRWVDGVLARKKALGF